MFWKSLLSRSLRRVPRTPNRRAARRPRIEALEDRLLLATRIWDGGDSTNTWGDRFNWVGNVAPGIGDDLVFPANAQQKNNFDNLPVVRNIRSLTIEGD